MFKILIVDDEAMVRMVAKRILSDRYAVVTAASAKEALEVFEAERPSLVLADVLMPEISGFELLSELHRRYGEDVKVMLMTADESQETESRSVDIGAVDFIRKPFQPNVLLRRVGDILDPQSNDVIPADASASDALTGLACKDRVSQQLREACKTSCGTLMLMNIDCFKAVNEIYGHNIGDMLLQGFAEIIRSNTRGGDIIGRIGNDIFITFISHVTDGNAISSITKRINKGLVDYAQELMGEAMSIPLGVSTGAVYVPENGTDFDDLFRAAEKTLQDVKQNGKHGHAVYTKKHFQQDLVNDDGGLQRFSQMFGERDPHTGAFFIKPDSFDYLYQFLMRYTITYHRTACKLLFTIDPKSPNVDAHCLREATTAFGQSIASQLRKSDLIAQVEDNQYLLFLPEITEADSDKLIERLLHGWEAKAFAATVVISCEKEIVDGDCDSPDDRRSTD